MRCIFANPDVSVFAAQHVWTNLYAVVDYLVSRGVWQRLVGGDDGVPPFHTLVGPGQFPRHERWSEQAQPGGETRRPFLALAAPAALCHFKTTG